MAKIDFEKSSAPNLDENFEKEFENTFQEAEQITNEEVPNFDPQHLENVLLKESEDVVAGLSEEEMRDANKIRVTIANTTAPIIIFFGPTKSGKTMALIRLTRFLKQNGYSVQPIRSFRPSYDSHYTKLCDEFDTLVDSELAAKGTQFISFMLLNVYKNGRSLCQILEAPGEYYYDPKQPSRPFPSYVNNIISCRNRKIWLLTTEPDWADQPDRDGYVNRIRLLKTKMRARDKSILFFNKIDLSPYVHSPGKVHNGSAFKYIKELYPGICEVFKNQNPITRLWKDSQLDFVCFQSGDFTTANDGSKMYQQGADEYPRNLWRIIDKRIKG